MPQMALLCSPVLRGETAPDILDDKLRQSRVFYIRPPDYAHWTSKGFYTSAQPREPQTERWGPSVRELRPKPSELNQE